MSGCTYEVTKRRVTVKKHAVIVRAYSQDEAIEIALKSNKWGEATSAKQHIEYDAQEMS